MSVVTDSSAQNSYQQKQEETMSMNTAATGVTYTVGDKTSIKKVKPKVSITDYEFGRNVG